MDIFHRFMKILAVIILVKAINAYVVLVFVT